MYDLLCGEGAATEPRTTHGRHPEHLKPPDSRVKDMEISVGPSALDDPPIILSSLGHLNHLELAIHDLRRGREGKSKPWALRHTSEEGALPVARVLHQSCPKGLLAPNSSARLREPPPRLSLRRLYPGRKARAKHMPETLLQQGKDKSVAAGPCETRKRSSEYIQAKIGWRKERRLGHARDTGKGTT